MKKTDSSPHPLTTRTAVDEVFQLLEQESDRGCILVAAAWIDELLGELIRARMIDHRLTIDNLFAGANAPLSTFSARIHIAHALGLLDEDEWKAINSIRILRNAAAHFEKTKKRRGFGVNFRTDSVTNEVENNSVIDEPLRAAFHKMHTPEQATRAIFQLGISLLVGGLLARIASTQRPPPVARRSREAWRSASEIIRAGFAEAEQNKAGHRPKERAEMQRRGSSESVSTRPPAPGAMRPGEHSAAGAERQANTGRSSAPIAQRARQGAPPAPPGRQRAHRRAREST